jgi:hypothetical protein
MYLFDNIEEWAAAFSPPLEITAQDRLLWTAAREWLDEE